MRLVVYVVFFLFCLSGYSQQIKVLDKETGKPIYNVTVFNESKSFSSTTNQDGIIDVSGVKNEDVLIFSHISYALYRIKKSRIDQRKNTVFLTKESEQLDEVVLSVFKGKNKATRIAEQIAVLTKGEIQQVSPQTSADLLASVPGIKVQKSQFGGDVYKRQTIMYVLMGWQIIFAIKPLLDALPKEGLQLLIWGGVFYTVGAILYSIKKIPYNHAIFHVFVLLGSASHFLCVYYYIS